MAGWWRARAGGYSDQFAAAMIEQALNPQALTAWAARDALASRGHDLAVRDLLTRAGHAVVSVVLALNRVYVQHRQLKWQRHLISGLDVFLSGWHSGCSCCRRARPP